MWVPEKIDAHEVVVAVCGDALRAGAGERLHRIAPEALLELFAGDGNESLISGERNGVRAEGRGGDELEEVFFFQEEFLLDFGFGLGGASATSAR